MFHTFKESAKQHFAFLFEVEGFAFVYEDNMKGGEYQLLITASSICQIKFTLEQECFDLSFGHLNAPYEFYEEDKKTGATVWYRCSRLMAFEDSRHPELALQLPPHKGEQTLDEVLAAYAFLLRHYLPGLTAAFSPKPPPDWWPNYLSWREASIARIRGAS